MIDLINYIEELLKVIPLLEQLTIQLISWFGWVTTLVLAVKGLLQTIRE